MDWIKWKLGLQKYYKHIWEYSSGMIMVLYAKDNKYPECGAYVIDCSFEGGYQRFFKPKYTCTEVSRQEYTDDV